MQDLKAVINKLSTDQLPTGLSNLNPTEQLAVVDQVSFKGMRGYEADALFEDLSDLTNIEFKRWYCKRFYELGKDRVLVLAGQAKADGGNPKKLFSYLLKRG